MNELARTNYANLRLAAELMTYVRDYPRRVPPAELTRGAAMALPEVKRDLAASLRRITHHRAVACPRWLRWVRRWRVRLWRFSQRGTVRYLSQVGFYGLVFYACLLAAAVLFASYEIGGMP